MTSIINSDVSALVLQVHAKGYEIPAIDFSLPHLRRISTHSSAHGGICASSDVGHHAELHNRINRGNSRASRIMGPRTAHVRVIVILRNVRNCFSRRQTHARRSEKRVYFPIAVIDPANSFLAVTICFTHGI